MLARGSAKGKPTDRDPQDMKSAGGPPMDKAQPQPPNSPRTARLYTGRRLERSEYRRCEFGVSDEGGGAKSAVVNYRVSLVLPRELGSALAVTVLESISLYRFLDQLRRVARRVGR